MAAQLWATLPASAFSLGSRGRWQRPPRAAQNSAVLKTSEFLIATLPLFLAEVEVYAGTSRLAFGARSCIRGRPRRRRPAGGRRLMAEVPWRSESLLSQIDDRVSINARHLEEL